MTLEEIYNLKCETCSAGFESNIPGRKFCSRHDPDIKSKATFETPIVRDPDLGGTGFEKSEDNPITDNIKRLNETARKFAAKVGSGIVHGRDQPKAIKFREDNPSGHFEGETWVVPHIEPWESSLMNTGSLMNAPTNAEWERLVSAYDRGELAKRADVRDALVRQYGEKRWHSILDILAAKSAARRRQLAENDRTSKVKVHEVSLADFYTKLGIEDLPLSCGHLLSSKLSPQVERIILGAPTAFCPVCTEPTDRKVIIDWLEKKLAS